MVRKISVFVFILFFSPSVFAKIGAIILDPGHGGKDPGAIDKVSKIQEKEINLSIAKELKKLIQKQMPWMNIYLTRNDDRYLSLNDRVKYGHTYASEKPIFISIHTNSHEKKTAQGIEVFYYNCSVENIDYSREKSIQGLHLVGFSEKLKNPLATLLDEKLRIDSMTLAEEIAYSLSGISGEKVRQISPIPFFVVSHTAVPSVLVEVGFISSAKLKNKENHRQVAKGILLGILDFMKKEDKF